MKIWRSRKNAFVVIMLAVIVISASVIGFSLSSGTINNIQNDLDGKKVNSSNNKHIWLFNQDQPLKYVILKKRSAGSNKNKNVYLNLFVETRQKPSNDSMMRAEGTIELRYSTNLTDNYLYLDGISPIDFRVLNMSIEESTLLDELNLFWEEFQIALINNYKEKISNSINYPLIGRYFPMCNDKSDLLKNYNLIFSDDVKEAIKNSILTPIPKAKGKEFSISKDEYIQTIDYNHLIEKDNFNYFFIVKRFENKFKIARIQEYLK